LNERDLAKAKRETALNDLESFVIDVRDKMYQETYEDSVTEEEKESISAKCSEISDWIDEEVTPDTEVEVLEEKLKALKELTSSWFARVREHLDRPEALAALDQMLNTSTNFLAKAINKTGKEKSWSHLVTINPFLAGDGEEDYFTQAEVDVLTKKLEEVQKWRDDALKEQEKQPKSEMPKMTTSLIAEKGLALDREVKYLLNKAKIAKAEKERAKKEAEEKAKKEEKKKKKKEEKEKEANASDGAASDDDSATPATEDGEGE